MRCKSRLPLTDRRPIAVYPICNWGGYEILSIDDERVEIAVNDGETRRYAGSHKLYTSKSGTTYFRRNGVIYHLDEFMRV